MGFNWDGRIFSAALERTPGYVTAGLSGWRERWRVRRRARPSVSGQPCSRESRSTRLRNRYRFCSVFKIIIKLLFRYFSWKWSMPEQFQFQNGILELWWTSSNELILFSRWWNAPASRNAQPRLARTSAPVLQLVCARTLQSTVEIEDWPTFHQTCRVRRRKCKCMLNQPRKGLLH